MTTQTKEQRAQTICKAREALQKARALRESRQTLGVDGIRQFVDDVDGDWLENWSEKDLDQLARNDKKILCPI
jgi:hypothetical protein